MSGTSGHVKNDAYNPFSAWKTAEEILPSFADALAEWLGANIIILAVTPLGSLGGEIAMQS
jgi:hypothetical protein